MPPSPPPPPPTKPYFYYGHRRPSQNRPVVYGGLFTNRRSPPRPAPGPPAPGPSAPAPGADFRRWDPQTSGPPSPPRQSVPLPSRRLSPLARHVHGLLLRHRRWGPPLVSELSSSLRRLTPHLLSELLRWGPPLPDPSFYLRLFHFASRQKHFHPTYSLFNSLTHSLLRSNLLGPADSVPDLMSSLSRPPTEKQLDILVRLHSRSGRGLRVYHLYRKFRTRFGVRPRAYLYNRILDGLVRSGHLDLALEVYGDLMADGGVRGEAITFTILARGLCKEGRVEEAIGILGRMRREVCAPDVFAYTAMLKVLANADNFEGCLRVWEEMRRDKVEPDVMAYATIVSGLCKNGDVEKGVELFREMKKKGLLIDRAVYGAMVDGFVRIGRVEEGFGVFKEMVDDGYRPDLGIYDSLIWGLCEDGRIDKARRLFQVAISEGLTLDFGTVTPLMVYYADSSEMDMFFRLIDQIEELGLPVMDHLADFFAVFLRKGERELNAVEVFEALKGKGYCSVAICNILIKALYKSKEGKRAVSLFEEIKSSQDLEPDTCTYSLVIPCYVDVEDVREACSCYNKMRELSWTPSVEAYCSLVKGLCKIREINPAIALVKDCLGNVTDGPMEFKYTLTILNACRLGKPEKVVEVLNEMTEEGYPLEDIIYCAVIHGFCKHASSAEARKVLAVMKNRNILSEASYIGYEDMLNEHLKKVTAGLVISTLKFYGLESKLKLSSSMD